MTTVGTESTQRSLIRTSMYTPLHLVNMIEAIPLQGFVGPDLSIPFLWVIFLLVAVWTYFDAEKNSSHPSILWALVVFIAPLLGIILYLIFGRN